MAAVGPKALFQGTHHSKIYERFRPSPPQSTIQAIIDFLAEAHGCRDLAVDVGCGTGQATRMLAPHFSQVLGLDSSSSQVKEATEKNSFENVSFKVSEAEHLPVEASSVDLITAFVALHWFDQEKFWREVNRVLKPGGVVAAFTFWDTNLLCDLPGFPEQCAHAAREEFLAVIKDFWNPLAYKAMFLYKDVEFPFAKVNRVYTQEMILVTLDEYSGYLQSFSPFQQLSKNNPKAADEALDKFVSSVLKKTGLEDPREVKLKVQRDFALVLCRDPK